MYKQKETADSNLLVDCNQFLVCFATPQSTPRIDCHQVPLSHVGFYVPSSIGKILKYSMCTPCNEVASSHVGFYVYSSIGKIPKYSSCTMPPKGDFSSGTCIYNTYVFLILRVLQRSTSV
jgi:hypothetical protein